MTVSLDNSNAINFFFSFMKMIRVDILDRFEIPGIGVSYWDFIIGLAITAVVLTVLVNTVRIGTVSYSNSKDMNSFLSRSNDSPSDAGGRASHYRSMHQRK